MSVSLNKASIIVAGVCALGLPLIAAGTLTAVGFTVGGVAYGSLAAAWMSSIGIVPAGSLFALLQSIGTLGIAGFVLSPPAIAFEVGVFSSVMCFMEKHSVKTAMIITSDFVSNVKQDIAIFFDNCSDTLSNVARSLETTGTRILACNQACLEFISKNFQDGTAVIDEKTRVHIENFIKDINTMISSIQSEDTTEIIRQHLAILANNIRALTENTINNAKSFASTINTKEAMEDINKHSKEAMDALEENTRVHRDNFNKATGECIENVQKAFEEVAKNVQTFTENTVNTATSFVATINTPENIDLINKRSKEVLDNIEETARVHRENFIRTTGSFLSLFGGNKLC